MASPNEKLFEILNHLAPKRVLVVSHSDIPALDAFRKEHSCEVVATPTLTQADINGLPQQDMVMVADWLEHYPPSEGRLLLGAIRNRLNPRILVAVDEARAGLGFTDFIGLGFRREGKYSQGEQQLSLYGYDLASYNHKRSWNNPDNWANPQNWGKYWW